MTIDDITVGFEVLRAAGVRLQGFKSDDDVIKTMKTWVLVLPDVTPEEFVQACVMYLRQPKSCFWPTPGQLLALIPRYQVDDADGRWGELLFLVRKHGHYNGPKRPGCGDPDEPTHWTIDEETWRGVQACGGWRELCMTTSATMASQRAAFRSAYVSAGERKRRQIEQHAASALLAESPRGLPLLEASSD